MPKGLMHNAFWLVKQSKSIKRNVGFFYKHPIYFTKFSIRQHRCVNVYGASASDDEIMRSMHFSLPYQLSC